MKIYSHAGKAVNRAKVGSCRYRIIYGSVNFLTALLTIDYFCNTGPFIRGAPTATASDALHALDQFCKTGPFMRDLR